MNKKLLETEVEALAMRAASLGDLIRFPNDKLVSDEEIDIVRSYARLAESINRLRNYVSYLPENEES